MPLEITLNNNCAISSLFLFSGHSWMQGRGFSKYFQSNKSAAYDMIHIQYMQDNKFT